jgi:predicted  nucleic acid-binding Zn-ribbon protein
MIKTKFKTGVPGELHNAQVKIRHLEREKQDLKEEVIALKSELLQVHPMYSEGVDHVVRASEATERELKEFKQEMKSTWKWIKWRIIG